MFGLVALLGGVITVMSLRPDTPRPKAQQPVVATPSSKPPAPKPDPRTVVVPRNFGARTLHIPALKATAPIDTVTVRDGIMIVPEDIKRVGVFDQGGPLDGTAGSVLVVGHINYAGSDGVIGKIGVLKANDVVITRGTKGPQAWRVKSNRMVLKANGLPPDIFRNDGDRVLTLVTCGGEFDSASGNYLSNIIVQAVPVPTVVK